MSENRRLIMAQYEQVAAMVRAVLDAWRKAGLIKGNSYAVTIRVGLRPGGDLSRCDHYAIKDSVEGAEHDGDWYEENADSKGIICRETGMDSHEAVRLYPGLIAHLNGAYPYGGGVIDLLYSLLICTSGFEEDEDIMISYLVLDLVIMMLDRTGQAMADDADRRGDQPGPAGADRFTRRLS
jgi:hypothetical protein